MWLESSYGLGAQKEAGGVVHGYWGDEAENIVKNPGITGSNVPERQIEFQLPHRICGEVLSQNDAPLILPTLVDLASGAYCCSPCHT